MLQFRFLLLCFDTLLAVFHLLGLTLATVHGGSEREREREREREKEKERERERKRERMNE